MKLTFLGTRGYIDSWNSRHRRHTSTLVTHRGKKVMIDCGEDWLKKVRRLAPDAIIITHPHPDHAFGLKGGTPCPVYAIQKRGKRSRVSRLSGQTVESSQFEESKKSLGFDLSLFLSSIQREPLP
jgi:ribonuclease BN (tRNA processing enzyme)